jgi:hypothetical protein
MGIIRSSKDYEEFRTNDTAPKIRSAVDIVDDLHHDYEIAEQELAKADDEIERLKDILYKHEIEY